MDCRRGEVFWVDWEPARGVEQRGRRPALVVQNDMGNRSSRATVIVAISSRQLERAYPFTVLLDGEAGLVGHINCSQLMTVDKDRLLERIGRLTADKMIEVSRAIRYELSLDSDLRS